MISQMTAEEIAKELHQKLENLKPEQRFMLGIVGYPGAGKSTAAHAIVESFNRLRGTEDAIVVPMDGFHLSNEELEKLDLLALKGIPETFDAAGFVELLRRLRNGDGTVCAPLFERSIEASIQGALAIHPEHRLLVVEGNYLLLNDPPWNDIRSLLNEVWFIDTTLETVYDRLVERHKQGGRTEEGAIEKVQTTDMRNAHLIDGTKIFADRLIAVILEQQSKDE
jgi:pantothenate kinase